MASSLGSTLQVVDAFATEWDPQVWGAVVNGSIPYLTGGGWWGIALGWIVGSVAVLTHRRAGRPTRAT